MERHEPHSCNNAAEGRELRGCKEEELGEICLANDLARFRGSQVFRWVQERAVRTWAEMTNIREADRKLLSAALALQPLELRREQRSQDGTRKYLFGLADGESIECVLMDYERRRARNRQTVCVSTQVGCPVGCAFCATGLGGFRRNLTAGEITGQVLELTRLLRREDEGFQVTNVVFMGMGEPFLNYEAVLKAIEILNSPQGQNIGMRRMTISTSGVVPGIRRLARDNAQVGLAVSLHAGTDVMRDVLVPMNRRYPLAELLGACREYSETSGRRVTFEVALTEKTANKQEASAVAKLLRGMLAHVNLIPVNPVAETGMKRPTEERITEFAGVLTKAGIPVSVREERGTDIEAACGQLRRRYGE
ncbi:putative dual-specificity RNA methyltransferase RlmN [Peptococcaceae bacterium CEB3]|nr:putative dual-specificity RNA methyltransferase RlmN [Peptococcaceae bacterium CEB3]